jgi:ABC-type nitrate/sulfonate/bicarbonate transport system substrate-binding protein
MRGMRKANAFRASDVPSGRRPVMKELRAQLAAICGALLAATSVFAPAGARDPETFTIRIGTAYPGIESMPVYVARQNGYFRDEHLSIDLTYLATGDKIAFALLGGSVNIARYTPDWFIRAVEKGGSRLKLVLGSGNSLIFSLLVPNTVKGYADLKGGRIGVSAIAAADTSIIIKMFAAHGLSKGSYSLIQAGSSPERAAALRAGSLAATLITPPHDQRIIDEGGFNRLDRSTDVIPRYAWGAEAVREEWASANAPKLVGYIRAWIKAFRFLRDPGNKEAVIQLLAREARIDDHYARGMYDLYYGPDAITVEKDGKPDLVGYQVMLNDMIDRGMIGAPAPSPDKFVDWTYWEKAQITLN